MQIEKKKQAMEQCNLLSDIDQEWCMHQDYGCTSGRVQFFMSIRDTSNPKGKRKGLGTLT